ELQKCNYTHFFNLVNATYDLLGLENYYCPDRLDNFNVSGIYTDDYFQYYEFTVQLKQSSLGKLEAVRKIFTDYEIKAEVYYMDSAITVFDFYNPMGRFLNSKFLDL